MIKIYIALIILIFVFAVAHMIYMPFYTELATTEAQLWFFSGGITMLLTGMINYIRLKIASPLVKYTCVIANFFVWVFTVILCFVLPEPQVFGLVVILLAATWVSFKYVAKSR
ncbi:MAG TPA: hypothetical protein PKE30_17525 [Niabella sp.]|nr:hypothetical protein [Niabella sp.]